MVLRTFFEISTISLSLALLSGQSEVSLFSGNFSSRYSQMTALSLTVAPRHSITGTFSLMGFFALNQSGLFFRWMFTFSNLHTLQLALCRALIIFFHGMFLAMSTSAVLCA